MLAIKGFGTSVLIILSKNFKQVQGREECHLQYQSDIISRSLAWSSSCEQSTLLYLIGSVAEFTML